MASPGKRDITFVKGDDYTHVITITSNGSTPIDITGRTYTAMIRRDKEDTGTAEATITCTLTTPASGILTLTMSDTVTSALSARRYWWDLQEVSGSTTTTILAGSVTVLPDVTHA
jgi:hypothetical protein